MSVVQQPANFSPPSHEQALQMVRAREAALRERTESELRAAIVAEARTWEGTRFHNCACVKGVGVDCANFIFAVYKNVGLVPADLEIPAYPPQWFLHRSGEWYLASLAAAGNRVLVAQPGDVALFKFGRVNSHSAIVLGETAIIHAYQPAQKVEVTDLGHLRSRFTGFWSYFP